MTRQLSVPFFRETPVFDRAEYALAVGRAPSDHVLTAMLTQHLKAGNIRRLARGVYASAPKHTGATSWSVDRFVVASHMRPGGVIAYHSALELLGYAHSEGETLHVAAPGQPGVRETAEFACRFVKPSAAYAPSDLQSVTRLGRAVEVTTLECTIADLFDRPDLSGGIEEMMKSLDLVKSLDLRRLTARLIALGNPTAVGAAGWWLERNMERLGFSDAAVSRLRPLAPLWNRYALGAGPGSGRLASGWGVILPEQCA